MSNVQCLSTFFYFRADHCDPRRHAYKKDNVLDTRSIYFLPELLYCISFL